MKCLLLTVAYIHNTSYKNIQCTQCVYVENIHKDFFLIHQKLLIDYNFLVELKKSG